METTRPITGSVAKIENQFALIINRGSKSGVQLGMVFAVLGDGEPIIDPETGDELGRTPEEKLRVTVTEVYEKYSRAETFRTYRPSPIQQRLASLLGPNDYAGIGEALSPSIANSKLHMFEGLSAAEPGSSFFEGISKALREEQDNPRPVRQKIANADPPVPAVPPVRREVTIDIGDRVRQIVEAPTNS